MLKVISLNTPATKTVLTRTPLKDISEVLACDGQAICYKNGGIRRIYPNNHQKRQKTETEDETI